MSQFYIKLHSFKGPTIDPLCERYALFKYLNFYQAAYKIAISISSLTVLFTIAYISYLVLEEGSPYIQTDMHSILLIKTSLLSFTLLKESLLISFPEATKILQFAPFNL